MILENRMLSYDSIKIIGASIVIHNSYTAFLYENVVTCDIKKMLYASNNNDSWL
jgi:hypothetical protein